MKIAAVLNIHDYPEVVQDTLNSICTFMTDKIIVVVDGCCTSTFNKIELPAIKITGFPHKLPKSPHRNMALGLMTLYETFPNEDWYCYTEWDALWGSDRFKQSLALADEQNIWMMGTNGHVDYVEMPLVESLVKSQFKSVYYLMGACQFFSRSFMTKLAELNFFERFLNLTNGFSRGHIPNYNGYDISEHMYPTMSRHFGGNIGVFSSYEDGEWHGSYEYFPIRWKPDLDPVSENFPDASIMHPLKTYDNPIRTYHREKRHK